MSIAKRMKRVRTERGLSQERLAEQLNVSRQTVSKWENGLAVPSGDNLNQLGKALGVSVDFLLNGERAAAETPAETPAAAAPAEETPAPQPGRRRLPALLAALLLAGSILIGALLFREWSQRPIPESELQSEVIDDSTVVNVPLLPLE